MEDSILRQQQLEEDKRKQQEEMESERNSRIQSRRRFIAESEYNAGGQKQDNSTDYHAGQGEDHIAAALPATRIIQSTTSSAISAPPPPRTDLQEHQNLSPPDTLLPPPSASLALAVSDGASNNGSAGMSLAPPPPSRYVPNDQSRLSQEGVIPPQQLGAEERGEPSLSPVGASSPLVAPAPPSNYAQPLAQQMEPVEPPAAPARRSLQIVEDDEQADNNISPQDKILLDMENLLILVNVWRDSEFGRKILAERGVSIPSDLRAEMDKQFSKLKEQIRELELCIVDLFYKTKNGQDINDTELQKILSQIKGSNDPDTSYFRNTILNFLNTLTVADNICLPQQLFYKTYTNRYTVDHVKYNIRRHIIYKHKFYFEKYDQSVLYGLSPNTSAQLASYNIQQELVNLIGDKKALDNVCADQEGIQNVVMNVIGKHLGLAGSIPVWFKEDAYFAKTLDIIARYNNHVDKHIKTGLFDWREKILPLENLFIRNPLSWLRKDFNNQQSIDIYGANKKNALIITILMIANYYLNTPLGKFHAEIQGVEENTEFGHKNRIKKLKYLAEKLAFDPVSDIDSINLLLAEIKSMIKGIWSSESRTKNELILIVQHFGNFDDKADLPKLKRIPKRFGNKDLFDYQMDKKEVDQYYQLHFSQELAKKLSHYHAVTSKRTRVKTAVCKDAAMWDLEKCVNEIYITPSADLHNQIRDLPNEYGSELPGDLPGLIHYKLQRVFDKNIPRSSISEQGQFGKTWYKVKSYFERMISGKIKKDHQDRIQHPRDVARNAENHGQNSRPISSRNLVLDKADFYVLSARLLAVINAYCCTDLAAEMNLELNDDDKGQKEYALTLANYIVELFLNIKQNAENNREQEASALNLLQRKILTVSQTIKGKWLTGGSRFARSLDELINSQEVNLRVDSLPFNSAKSIKLFPDENTDDAKRMIHRHMIDQVCTHYVDFEQNIQGKLSDQPGEFEQKAAVETRKRLKALSHMNLADQNKEIADLNNPDASMRDVIIAAIASPIVRCGIVTRRFGHHFNNLLQAACRSIKKFNSSAQEEVYIETLLVPGLSVRKYGMDNGQDIHNPEKNMFKLLGSIQIICKYYLDDTLGRQYADAKKFPQHKKHGWDNDVLQLLRLAEHLYLRNKNAGESDGDYIKNNMTLLLEKMNTVIDKIRGSLSKDSSFANELISLMNRYGGVYQINTDKRLTATRYKEGQFLIDPARLTVEECEDFMQLNLIQKVFTELSYFRTTTDMHGSVHSGDSSAFLQMEKNLDTLYNMTIEQRRAEMARLPDGQKNIVNLIKRYIPHNVPYNFLSPNSYLRKGEINGPIERIYKYFDEVRKPIELAVNNVRPQVQVN